MTNKRESNVNSVTVEEFIHVISILGKGTADDPVHIVHEYFDMDGQLVGRVDTMDIGKEDR